MRKKITALVLALCLVVSAFGLVSCGDKSNNQSALPIKYNTRYIRDNGNIRSSDTYMQTYIIFTSSSTGEYHCYYYYSYNDITEFTVKFKYTVLDSNGSTIRCFYDSVTYGEHHTEGIGSRDNWSMTVSVSENVLMETSSSGFGYFINENYLNSDIPNYRK